ncbi:MAG: hypothetical protein ACJ8FY_08270 [Gemmataceae bacterium]
MLAQFCLRLAVGLGAALLILSPGQINPRFYRTHFLTIIGLATGALLLLHGSMAFWLGLSLGLGLASAFLGSLAWSLHGAPGGRLLTGVTAIALGGALIAFEADPMNSRGTPFQGMGWILASDFASAWLLGTATTAMLMGHSYLVAPAMSLTPLLRLLAALLGAVFIRAGLAGWSLVFWTREHSLVNLEDVTIYWLPLRWGMSFLGPLICGWMAWQSARIRSTQSATGILYVVVVFCFLGDLTGQLLQSATGLCL